MSTRNSDTAVAHLVQKTGAKYVFISQDNAMTSLAKGVEKIVGADEIQFLSMPSFKELFELEAEIFEPLPPLQHPDENATVVILHSSGLSTVLMKYISQSDLS
jgi:hypothetical protein